MYWQLQTENDNVKAQTQGKSRTMGKATIKEEKKKMKNTLNYVSLQLP